MMNVKTEPVLVIVGAGIAATNAVLALALTFVTVEAIQAAAMFAVINPVAALIAALATRGRVSPVLPEEQNHGV